MKFVIQRVKNAGVSIGGDTCSSIGKGLLVFFCAEKGDELGGEYGGKKLDIDAVLSYFANKILKLRVFEENLPEESKKNGKMNCSVFDIGGEILVVSQFTLAANCKKGARPSFDFAMEPVLAKKMYEDFVEKLRAAAKSLSQCAFEHYNSSCCSELVAGFKTPQSVVVKTGVFAADMQVSLVNDGPVTILM